MESNNAYYRRRAVEEDEATANAACDASRDRHRQLAALYRKRCERGRGDASPLPVLEAMTSDEVRRRLAAAARYRTLARFTSDVGARAALMETAAEFERKASRVIRTSLAL